MYLLERFGIRTLPPYNSEMTESPIPAAIAFVETTGGIYDNDGNGRSRQALPFALRYQGVILENLMTDTRAYVDMFRPLVGIRSKLYRRARDNDEVHWCYARLVAMPYETNTKDKAWRTVTLDFQQLSRWHGARHDDPWTFDSGEVFDDGLILDEESPTILDTNPKVTAVINNGNIPIQDAQIFLTAAGSNITAVTFTGTNSVAGITINLTWTGTLTAGQILIINDAASSVLNNGVNAYTGLVRNSGHNIAPWFEFAPGTTNITVTRTGGSAASTIAIIFRDGWA